MNFFKQFANMYKIGMWYSFRIHFVIAMISGFIHLSNAPYGLLTHQPLEVLGISAVLALMITMIGTMFWPLACLFWPVVIISMAVPV